MQVNLLNRKFEIREPCTPTQKGKQSVTVSHRAAGTMINPIVENNPAECIAERYQSITEVGKEFLLATSLYLKMGVMLLPSGHFRMFGSPGLDIST
jgi:hypothetical protein